MSPQQGQQMVALKEENQLLRKLNEVYCQDALRLEGTVLELQGLLAVAHALVASLENAGDQEALKKPRRLQVWGRNMAMDWSTAGVPKQFRQASATQNEDGALDLEVDWSGGSLPHVLRPQRRVAGPCGSRRSQRVSRRPLRQVALKTPALRAALALAKLSAEKPSAAESIKRATPLHAARCPVAEVKHQSKQHSSRLQQPRGGSGAQAGNHNASKK
ncbi:unnamed protein product [Polarella glacialis]|uniref:Uncharacterized protein n=1 Tax=Polarella glacialis TaxID=89957 RepID=A0A813D717_POLGL|nr:unnamed protein product [Polarella glacialis]